MITNTDIAQGAVTETKLSKNLRLKFKNIETGTAGQVPVVQADGSMAYKTIGGDATLAEDGTLTVTKELVTSVTTTTPVNINDVDKSMGFEGEEKGYVKRAGDNKFELDDRLSGTKAFYVKWDNTAESTPPGMVSFSGTDVTLTHNFGTGFIVASILDITNHQGDGANRYLDLNFHNEATVFFVDDNNTKISFNDEPDADDDFKITLIGGTE